MKNNAELPIGITDQAVHKLAKLVKEGHTVTVKDEMGHNITRETLLLVAFAPKLTNRMEALRGALSLYVPLH